MIPFLPALLLLLMQGSLDGDALDGRVQQLWLARVTGHSTHLDQAAAEEAICALLFGSKPQVASHKPTAESQSQVSDHKFADGALNLSAAPRDGPQA
jgi:hypothetical protein